MTDQARTQSVLVPAEPGTVVPVHEVLRDFDLLRRRLSMQLTGEVGVFVGYETPFLPESTERPTAGPLVLTATCVKQFTKHHLVEYVATARVAPSEEGAPRNTFVVWSGRGTTVTPARLDRSSLPFDGPPPSSETALRAHGTIRYA